MHCTCTEVHFNSKMLLVIKDARDHCLMIAILSRAKFEHIAGTVRADREHTCDTDRDLLAIWSR